MEGAGGPCRGAGGRWQGLAGQRVDAPSEARGADGSRAGRRPPAHTAAGPSGTRNTSGATSTPVETFFAPACGSSTPVEIFFAHAHPKWLIFDHFHRAGAIFLSQRHPKRPPGATQGRSFFHAAPSGPQREPAALPGRGAHEWRDLSGQRGDAPNHTPAHQAPPVSRAPEGPEGLAAVPVGGGGAWPDNESTRRAKLAARTARRRAAAHGHTKQPSPPTHHTAPRTPAGPQASRPTGTHSDRTIRRPAARGHTKPPDPTGAGRLRQSARGTQRRITTMSGSPRPLS